MFMQQSGKTRDLNYKNKQTKKKTTKHNHGILCLLQAVLEPAEVAVMHCQGHLKGDSTQIIGNRPADQAAKKAALLELPGQFSLFPREVPLPIPSYSPSEEETALSEGLSKTEEGWWITSDTKIFDTFHCKWAIFKSLHG